MSYEGVKRSNLWLFCEFTSLFLAFYSQSGKWLGMKIKKAQCARELAPSRPCSPFF